jgi:hypothetical protein
VLLQSMEWVLLKAGVNRRSKAADQHHDNYPLDSVASIIADLRLICAYSNCGVSSLVTTLLGSNR